MEKETIDILKDAVKKLEESFAGLPPLDTTLKNPDAVKSILLDIAERFKADYPYFHPLYAGQMMKPPHPMARAAYMLALWINPNNHALDGGRTSSAMEKEAVAEIAQMFGWKEHLGHLTSGGTMANLEALWIAGQLAPGKKVIASKQAHYTHSRISAVLGLPFESVDHDDKGRMDLVALEKRLSQGDVGTVVVTLGTTATGSVDPLRGVLKLREKYGFRIHVDSAFGGYFTLASNLADDAREEYAHISEADSIVVDPHKHGLQPYGCGCVIFRDSSVGRFYKHDSPYTYFTSDELHLGEISLECSRPGASAVALWATQKLLPLVKGGEFARELESSRRGALAFYAKLKNDERFTPPFEPELDIVVWAVNAPSVSEASEKAGKLFDAAAKRDLHLALAELPLSLFHFKEGTMAAAPDQTTITCLRSTLMKPQHEEWIDRIWTILDEAGAASASATSPLEFAR
jgi:glutamate/tyrosine decarboxylase-like PLP-dependent enzyme